MFSCFHLQEDYLFAVKKSIVDFVLKEPEIDEDERFSSFTNLVSHPSDKIEKNS
jgi:hypothetical protein